MIAHIRESDGKEQSLQEHLKNVERLCTRSAEALGLSHLAGLIARLHDMGKANHSFAAYLRACFHNSKSSVKHPTHAATGAIYAWERWGKVASRPQERLTAQIVALTIQGHHAGLPDCLSATGTVPFQTHQKDENSQPEVKSSQEWFLQNITSADELDRLFGLACQEVETFCRLMHTKSYAFECGMLARMMLSFLVDADRWDAACFEQGHDALLEANPPCSWAELEKRFDEFRINYLNSTVGINGIRCEISDQCHAFAKEKTGIYMLSVPTGGGKTFASLRYALSHAQQTGKTRVFYIIPYNTILDQNARDIRRVLGEDAGILEHHSNVVLEDEETQEKHRRLTERWDMPIILTSLVQFLNACFAGKNTEARRFHRLTDAVLIFDEIQSLPKHCKKLFEQAISFLSRCCGSTVLLCTATQPRLCTTPEAREMMPDVAGLYQSLSRVRYLPDIAHPKSNEEAAAALTELLAERSVLAVVNTKKVADEIAKQVTTLLQEQGFHIVTGLTDQPPTDEKTILCVPLSTNLCPAHRLRLLDQIKGWNQQGWRVCCVSTALIEAGINVSFPVVVRSLAGLPSIVQAAGRCNRNMESACGDVCIWHLKEEKLSSLPDIQNGGTCTRNVIDRLDGAELGTTETIERYFQYEECYTKEKQDYPIERNGKHRDYEGYRLYHLLAKNKKCASAYKDLTGKEPTDELALCQSFRTAGEIFQVIPDQTKAVVVPFEEGKELIAELGAAHTMQEELRLLRKAQMYSVNLYSDVFDQLAKQGAIAPVGECGAWALKDGYYSVQSGVRTEREEMELLQV